MKLSIKAGATSVSVNVFIQDSSSSTGAGLTGLVFNTSSLTAYYALTRAAAVQIALVTLAAVTTAWTSGGFKEIDATNMPGWYRLDIPDAALASGRFSCIHLKGAANMAPLPIEIALEAVDNQDGVRMGMTALPNAAAEAAGGLYTRGSGAGQINQAANGMVDANVVRNAGTAITATAGRQEVNVTHWLGTAVSTPTVAGVPNVNAKTWNDLPTVALPLVPTTAGRTLDVSAGGEAGVDWANVGTPTSTVNLSGTTIAITQKVDVDTIKTQAVTAAAGITFPTSIASPTNITAGTITTVTNLTNAPTVGDLTAAMKASVTTAATAATPTAAAVTGNVGGNVVGSIGSLATQAKADVNAEADTALSDVGVTLTVTGRIDAAVSTRLASAGYTAPDNSSITAIKAKTDGLPSDPADASDIASAFGTVNSTLAAIAGYVDTEVGAIKAKTDQLTFTVANQVDVNVVDWKGATAPAMTGDAFARLGAPAGASIAADIATIDDFVDTEVAAIKGVTDKLNTALESTGSPTTYRLTAAALEQAPSGGGGLTVQDIVDGVWDEPMADHLTGGSTGASLNGAGSAGDPWTTALPGAYGAGTAGKIVGDALDAAMSSRASQTSVDDVAGDVTDILADTADIQPKIGAPAGASLSADVAAVKAQTVAIETDTQDIQTRLPATLVSGRIDASVGAMAANVMTAAAAASDLTTELQTGLATASALTSVAGEVTAVRAKTDNLPSDPADQSLIIAATTAIMDRVGAPAGASIAADVAAVKSDSAAILLDTGTDGVVVAAASKTGFRLSATGVDDVLDEVVDGTTTLRQSVRLANSALGGKASGLATTAPVYRDLADTKDRIAATVDADGNRSTVTLDLN